MIFRQLFDSVSGTYSYLLASRRGAEALIIDPVLEKVDRYIQLMNELDLRLVKAVDTHLHADHVTGLGALRDRTRCVTVMGENTKADVVSMRLADGDRLDIEGVSLDVIYTPGHTDNSYSFALEDRVFTGDTLLIRGTGRTDFQNGRSRAAVQLDLQPPAEIAQRHAGLPGARLQGRHGQHDRRGTALQSAAAGEIRGRVCRADEQSETAEPEDDGRGGSGQHAYRPGPGRRRPEGLGGSCGGCSGSALRRPDVALVDLREKSERERHGTIPGALHEPYPKLRDNLEAGGLLRALGANRRVVFFCAYGERSAMAVQAAQEAGITSACHIQGGIAAWKAAGGPIER